MQAIFFVIMNDFDNVYSFEFGLLVDIDRAYRWLKNKEQETGHCVKLPVAPFIAAMLIVHCRYAYSGNEGIVRNTS